MPDNLARMPIAAYVRRPHLSTFGGGRVHHHSNESGCEVGLREIRAPRVYVSLSFLDPSSVTGHEQRSNRAHGRSGSVYLTCPGKEYRLEFLVYCRRLGAQPPEPKRIAHEDSTKVGGNGNPLICEEIVDHVGTH